MEDQDILNEFLIESAENLARLDLEMVELEQRPDDRDLLASVFRTIHTIKGTCGFLGFGRLEALAHVTEDILSDLRHGKRRLDSGLATLILESVDGIKRILASLENGEGEGAECEADLKRRLEKARDGATVEAPRKPESAAPPPASREPEPPPAARAAEAAAADRKEPHDAASKAPTANESTLRVDVSLLDRLMNLVGELVLTRNQVLQYNAAREDAALNTISQRLNLITTELQESVMKTRMQPIGVVWNKLPRVVRDLAAMLNKQIALEMEGAGTELDRAIIEAIKDPLTHIVRNSCDHGIESPEGRAARGKPPQGRLAMRAFHEGGQVNIEIADDGAGIDPERVKAKAVERGLISVEQAQRLSERDAVHLVFLPGFSTAQTVTNVSGRGVGMDVVKTHIERIGGTVDLISSPGKGTTIRVKIPLTLAIIPGLVVSAGGERFLIPQISLDELVRLEGEAARTRIEHIQSTPVLRRRDGLLPLADLSQVLQLTSRRPEDEISIVVLQADEHKFGLVVDSISDSQEIVVKPLGQQLKSLDCYAGATIMGDGKIALILDVAGVGIRAGVIAESGQQPPVAASVAAKPVAANERTSLLLFRAGAFSRIAMPLSAVARLEKIPRSQVEKAGGRTVLQYRGGILPLVRVGEMLGGYGESAEDLLQVVIYRHGATDVGLVVDEIIDVVEDSVGSPYATECAGLLGSAVVGGKMTDFLDPDAVAQWTAAGAAASIEKLRSVLAGGGSVVPQEAWR
jgi:two-component system chemotaxis sensor kinase CheA